ncbi:hypothetical protein [Comamonas antarctica]|uniref:hypothetical protein n=1 Tax=Comamonas antarctica TaxID=2743470 RepID=UPI0028E97591|nr:hypothetical protein [Comamonas antarctica]
MTAQTQAEALRLADALAYCDSSVASQATAELRRLHAENEQLRAEAKHWRSNHDNLAARLRVFTQRPDVPKELADRLPWYRELVRLQELEAQAQPAREPLAEFIERCGEVRFQRVRAGVGGPLRWDIEFTTNGGRQEVEVRGSTLALAIAGAIIKEKP